MDMSQIIVLSAIIAAFAIFAVVLAWGDYQTRNLKRTAQNVSEGQSAAPVKLQTARHRATVVAYDIHSRVA